MDKFQMDSTSQGRKKIPDIEAVTELYIKPL